MRSATASVCSLTSKQNDLSSNLDRVTRCKLLLDKSKTFLIFLILSRVKKIFTFTFYLSTTKFHFYFSNACKLKYLYNFLSPLNKKKFLEKCLRQGVLVVETKRLKFESHEFHISTCMGYNFFGNFKIKVITTSVQLKNKST